ncbi:MAG: sigma-54 dependent transcriptional regulator [Myxococcota bacterium]|nr:sigma-54 dependent transcriptional regulator [Myxococcota bacterium]
MRKRVLIIDDEPSIRKVLAAHLKAQSYEVQTASDGGEGISRLQNEQFHAVVTDLKMPGIGGLEVLHWVRSHDPGLPVVIITAHGTVDTAVEAIKLGAHDYITKPFDRDELKLILEKAVRTEQVQAQSLSSLEGRFDIIGRTPKMQQVYELIERVANSPTTVLITGESGTGKELVARALHTNSSRKDEPFISVNCGAIPDTLFESELFGHEKGAFTGAIGSRPGRFELADGGTLFLDEVGELPLDMQVKLLRVLQERKVDRVGGLKPIEVDVRLITSTNRDLSKEVEEGSFRQDLFYRLNVIPIHLPPLRERTEDIPLLVKHFLERFNVRLDRNIEGLTAGAEELLQRWEWPGNIRELENLMERTVLLCQGNQIEESDLPSSTQDTPLPDVAANVEELGLKAYVRAHTAKLERARILEVLEAETHNVTRAAKALGISRKSLQTKMKDYGLRDDGNSSS